MNRNLSYQVKTQPIKFVQFQEFVKINMQQLKHQTGMASKEKGMLQLHNIRPKFRIVHYHTFQYLNFDFGLFVKFRLVSDDF